MLTSEKDYQPSCICARCNSYRR